MSSVQVLSVVLVVFLAGLPVAGYLGWRRAWLHSARWPAQVVCALVGAAFWPIICVFWLLFGLFELLEEGWEGTRW